MPLRYMKMSFVALAATLCFSQSLFAHEGHDHDEMEAELTERIRSEQNQFFQQMHEDIANGVPVDVASGQCKYISSIFRAPPSGVVALTFDDGPNPKTTPQALAVLKKYGIKATFFMKGENGARYPDLVKRVKAEGHLVAAHSYSHANFHTLPSGNQYSEIMMAEKALKVGMNSGIKLFRYPYGNSTCYSNDLAHKQNYGIVGWHIDSCDWAFTKGYVTSKQAATCAVKTGNMSNYAGHVMDGVRKKNGGIVLMHDIHANTVNSLEQLIVGLQREGFRFANMDDPIMKAYIQ